jgi:hypothetical protein
VVVEATLLKIKDVHDKDDPEGITGRLYTLSVNRTLRGSIQKTFKVYEGNDSGRASFDWSVGTAYVLFLFNSPDTKAWSLEGCGNSTPAARAESVLRDITSIKHQRQGTFISGVVKREDTSALLPSVHLVIRGDGRTFEATTDQSGRFQVEVLPGTYSIEPVDPPIPLEPYVLTYENPHHLTVQPSGCAQVQFSEARTGQ